MLNQSLNEQAALRGAAARTQLLAVASKPVWNVIGGAVDAVEAHLFGPPLAFWWDEDEDEGDAPACGYTVTDAGIAIIPMHGTLVDSEPSWWMNYLGYCSIPQIARAVTAAAADGNVKNILLDVKSPGGHVSGLAAACDAVWAVNQAGKKQIWAACSLVASAAYEICSQCNKMYLSPDGMGGCIGTIYLLSDWSAYYSQMGIVNLRVTSTGAETYKGGGARGTKITPAQQADFKRLCNEFRQLFNTVIQRGRGFSDETMTQLADGRIHIGANALQLSLVDGIATPEAVLSALGGGDDLDDLAGPPSQADPDGDDDDDDDNDDPEGDDDTPEDILSALQEYQALTNKPKTEAAPASSGSRLDSFLSWLNGEKPANENGEKPANENGEKPANESSAQQNGTQQNGAPPPLQSAEPHPVLTAALSAGLDTPEKLQEVLAERQARQETERTTAAQALTTARAAAQSAAVTAYGQDTPDLKAAQDMIGKVSDVSILQTLTATYARVKPVTLKPGAPRQTKVEKTQADDQAVDSTTKAEDQLAANLNPENVYASRRAKPMSR